MTTFVPLSTTPVVYLGETQVGAILQVFDAQTLTPRTVFKDGLATIPWLQASFGLPIPAGAYITDASGRVPVGFVVGNPYRIRCISSKGQEIFDIDNLPGDVAAGGGGGGGGGGTATLNTGDFVFAHTTAQITGRVRANGKTIGSLASGATERANGADHLHSDVFALYAFLWSDTSLGVSGGRGANAAADFDANKQLSLPDYNARTLFGIDGMGSTPTGRLANAIFATGNATTLGSMGGEGAHTLVNAENGTHGHTGVTLANAAFQMSFTTSAAGGHLHNGSTAIAVGNHTHFGSVAPSHTHDLSGMSFGGAHAHGGLSGGSDTFFQMNSTGISMSQSTTNFPTSASGASGFTAALVSSTLNLGLSGTYFQDHHHGISTDGSHIHGGTTGLSGSLALSMVGDGAHGHALSIVLDGSHVHSGSTDLGGAHTHIFATDLSGGGAAHNNMPPFGLATCYIVL